jgi:hypothetical protein
MKFRFFNIFGVENSIYEGKIKSSERPRGRPYLVWIRCGKEADPKRD